jgi:uncharacterized RDD family membrane protein YckC
MQTSDGAVAVATSEAVALALDVAGLGHRALAWFADAAIIATFWFTVLFLISYARTFDLTQLGDVATSLQVLLVLAFFATNWGYAFAFEALWHGQTPGKRLLGIRVARLDGSPAGVLELALRNVCRGVDFLPCFYVTGVIALAATHPPRRLGDLVAGTLCLREQHFDLSRYTAPVPRTASGLAPLTPAQLELTLGFLQRAPGLDDSARDALAVQIAALFASRVAAGERASLADPRAAEALLRALARGEG